MTAHWELWAEVFQRAVDSARALGSRRDEAVHLNYLAWSYNFCLHDYPAALAAAQAALAAAYEAADQLQAGWALGYEAGALRRLGRTDESIVRLHEAATHLRNHTDPQVRLAELTILNTLGQHLRYANRADEALVIHRRSEALCLAGVPGCRTTSSPLLWRRPAITSAATSWPWGNGARPNPLCVPPWPTGTRAGCLPGANPSASTSALPCATSTATTRPARR